MIPTWIGPERRWSEQGDTKTSGGAASVSDLDGARMGGARQT